MRMIEREMNDAIDAMKPWAKDNTQVTVARGDWSTWAHVYLHGHLIATVERMKSGARVFSINHRTLKQWPTRTTMSRLRALGFDVCTRKGVVHLDGKPLED